MLKLLFALATLFFSSFAMAQSSGFKAEAAAMRYSTATEGPALGESDQVVTIFDIKVGYIFSNKLYFGAILDSKNISNSSSTDKRSATGVTFGYHNDWYADFSYFLTAERDLAGGTKLKDGKGYAFDLGYHSKVNSNVFVGLQLSYKSFTYEKNGDVAQTNKEKSEMYPMLTVGVIF